MLLHRRRVMTVRNQSDGVNLQEVRDVALLAQGFSHQHRCKPTANAGDPHKYKLLLTPLRNSHTVKKFGGAEVSDSVIYCAKLASPPPGVPTSQIKDRVTYIRASMAHLRKGSATLTCCRYAGANKLPAPYLEVRRLFGAPTSDLGSSILHNRYPR